MTPSKQLLKMQGYRFLYAVFLISHQDASDDEVAKKMAKLLKGDYPNEAKTREVREAEKVKNLLEDEHYGEAISKACKLLFGLIRRKSGVDDEDAMKLIDRVFTPQKPILRFTHHAEHRHVKGIHEGYYFLLRGVVAAFRNPVSHENLEIGELETQAQIALITYLYILIDDNSERVPPKTKK